MVRARMAHNLSVDECLALMRDRSLKPDSIAEEMECAGLSRPSAEQVEAARDVLAEIEAEAVARTAGLQAPGAGSLAARIAALPEMLALALVHAAGRASHQDVLIELAQGQSRAMAKEAKRELHRLKQKGVQVQEVRPQGDAVLKPLPEVEAPPCYASSIDAYGERAVWWTRPARQGVEVVQVVLSDVKGILAADALGVSRRSFRELVKRMPRQTAVTTVEIPKDHARQLIADAEARGARNGFSPPPSYREALRILGPAPSLPPRPPGESIELPDPQAHRMDGASLFEDPLFAAWIPEEDALRSFALKVDEISVSRLYVDAAQRQQAFERAADDAAQQYFTAQRRGIYARRLVEMAHVLAQESRIDAARRALAVARALEGEGPLNPFCRALFTHALRDRMQPAAAPPGPSAGTSPLITP